MYVLFETRFSISFLKSSTVGQLINFRRHEIIPTFHVATVVQTSFEVTSIRVQLTRAYMLAAPTEVPNFQPFVANLLLLSSGFNLQLCCQASNHVFLQAVDLKCSGGGL